MTNTEIFLVVFILLPVMGVFLGAFAYVMHSEIKFIRGKEEK